MVKEESIQTYMQDLHKFFTNIKDAKVDMESSNTWYRLYRLLSEKYHVVFSNAVKTKATASAKIKTDKLDAKILADLLRGG
ncbi:MAG: transposase [Nitrososphaerales archaeon]